MGWGPQDPRGILRAGSAVLFSDRPPKPIMVLAHSRCSVNSHGINKCCGGGGFMFLMMAKGQGLAVGHPFVLGNQLEVQAPFPVKVLGLDSQWPVELELPAM